MLCAGPHQRRAGAGVCVGPERARRPAAAGHPGTSTQPRVLAEPRGLRGVAAPS